MSGRLYTILTLLFSLALAGPSWGSQSARPSQPKKSVKEDTLPSKLAIRHYARAESKDLVTETENFRVVFNKNPELMEKIVRHAESVRLLVHNRWFGDAPNEWDGRVTIYLYDSHKQYLKQTGVTALAHARARTSGGFITSRTVSLPLDLADLFDDVLPHEVTHTVMANRFNGKMPRWADEGVAVLSESPARLTRRRIRLSEAWKNQELFGPEVLFTTEDENHTGSSEYYEQSMSIIQFFVAEKGHRTFVRFITDSLDGQYRTALKNHYGINSFDELQKRWAEHTFSSKPPRRDDGPRIGTGLCLARYAASGRNFELTTAHRPPKIEDAG